MSEFTIEDAKKVVKAWEALPGGKNYSARDIQAWLVDSMAPAINELRQKIKAHKELKKGQ